MSTCQICQQDLTVELDPESFDEASSSAVGESTTAPDDLTLQCGCHFHFQCLLDESPEIALTLVCPSCENSIVTGPSASFSNPKVVTQYINEGGLQEDLDILPLITEEAYLDLHPSARPARALMTLYGEGDLLAIVELLRAVQVDTDEGDMSPSDLIRFQDPLDKGRCGLHVAIEKGQLQVVWLLLWLASGLPSDEFPGDLRQLAASMEIGRETSNGPDIRSLKDEFQRTGGDLARDLGGLWSDPLFTRIL